MGCLRQLPGVCIGWRCVHAYSLRCLICCGIVADTAVYNVRMLLLWSIVYGGSGCGDVFWIAVEYRAVLGLSGTRSKPITCLSWW